MISSVYILLFSLMPWSDPISYTELVSVEHDIATYEKLQSTINLIRKQKIPEPGFVMDATTVSVNGHDRPDLFTFSGSFIGLFSALQQNLNENEPSLRAKFRRLHNYGMSHDELELLEFLLKNTDPISEIIEGAVERYRDEQESLLKMELTISPKSRDLQLRAIKNVIMGIGERRVVLQRDWTFAFLENFSKQSQYAFARMIQEHLIPGSAFTFYVEDENETLVESILEHILSDGQGFDGFDGGVKK